MDNDVVVIGSGIAGTYVTYNLVKYGLEPRRITLIAREWPPYSKHRFTKKLECKLPDHSLIIPMYRYLEFSGVKILRNYSATKVLGNYVIVGGSKDEFKIKFNYLVIATGSKPYIPLIEGVRLGGITTFHDFSDLKLVESMCSGSRVLIVGGGLIGTSLAYVLSKLGFRVLLTEVRDSILLSVIDRELANVCESYLRSLGIVICTKCFIKRFVGHRRVTSVVANSTTLGVDYVVLATGVRPNVGVVSDLGLRYSGNAIWTYPDGRTSLSHIYALGDCAISYDYITGKEVYRPLGFIAGHYAKLVAKSIVSEGKAINDRGVIPTIYEELGNFKIIRIGLSYNEAESLGISCKKELLKSLTYRELIVRTLDGDIVGWQFTGFSDSVILKSWNYYVEIKSKWSRA